MSKALEKYLNAPFEAARAAKRAKENEWLHHMTITELVELLKEPLSKALREAVFDELHDRR